MKICVKCKKEMLCSKNGVAAVWHKNHAYAGDKYKCPKCLTEVLVTNLAPHQINELEFQALKALDCLLEMSE